MCAEGTDARLSASLAEELLLLLVTHACLAEAEAAFGAAADAAVETAKNPAAAAAAAATAARAAAAASRALGERPPDGEAAAAAAAAAAGGEGPLLRGFLQLERLLRRARHLVHMLQAPPEVLHDLHNFCGGGGATSDGSSDTAVSPSYRLRLLMLQDTQRLWIGILSVWATLFSPPVVLALQRAKVKHSTVRVAVLIQLIECGSGAVSFLCRSSAPLPFLGDAISEVVTGLGVLPRETLQGVREIPGIPGQFYVRYNTPEQGGGYSDYSLEVSTGAAAADADEPEKTTPRTAFLHTAAFFASDADLDTPSSLLGTPHQEQQQRHEACGCCCRAATRCSCITTPSGIKMSQPRMLRLSSRSVALQASAAALLLSADFSVEAAVEAEAALGYPQIVHGIWCPAEDADSTVVGRGADSAITAGATTAPNSTSWHSVGRLTVLSSRSVVLPEGDSWGSGDPDAPEGLHLCEDILLPARPPTAPE
ncbi:hypothetical protein cyc_05723 [Cyclospora cayetanensis]|uniref:Uncharacterized protein n=1 Tax=Cyclospora cayetanensis TaxID=88456 RepID=A0A1D3CWA1_9EIME|nr:hypothetical protein cyc_05723 [Cyclospora cayetanensis]